MDSIQAFFRKTSLQTKQKKLLYSYVLPFEMISFHLIGVIGRCVQRRSFEKEG
jgi:hypothetical protein